MNTNLNNTINNIVSRKSRSDASWSKLTNAQQVVLEEWLFEEHLSYAEVLVRAQNVLGFVGSVWGLKRFYKKRAQVRLLRDLAAAAAEAAQAGKAAGDVTVLEEGCQVVLAQQLFDRVRHEGVADVGVLGRMVTQGEANRRRRERLKVQQEAQALRRERLELDRERLRRDVVADVVKVLPEMIEMEKLRGQEEDPYFDNKRINRIRMNLFGPRIPEILPESVDEELALWASEKVRQGADNFLMYEI